MSVFKYNFAFPVNSGSWEKRYAVAAAAAAKLTNVAATAVKNPDGTDQEFVTADYIGSGAITLSDYAGFPIYSKIWDHQANTYHIKKAAAGTSTWVTLTPVAS